MDKIGTIVTGLSGKTKSDFNKDGNALYATYKNVFDNPSLDLAALEPVAIKDDEKQNMLQKGDIIFTASSETAEEAGMSSIVTEEPTVPVYLNSFCFALRPNKDILIDPDFSKHLMRSHFLRKQISKTANGVTRYNISKVRLLKVAIPVPPIEVQQHIAGVLNKFDALANGISEGLPAEIEGRRKQYEYYRDKLLTFKEKVA